MRSELQIADVSHALATADENALFAAFVIPSALFGWWSFQRLRADDAQRRDLVVREKLRGIAAAASAEELSAVAAEFSQHTDELDDKVDEIAELLT